MNRLIPGTKRRILERKVIPLGEVRGNFGGNFKLALPIVFIPQIANAPRLCTQPLVGLGGQPVFHSCIAGLKISIYEEHRSTKVSIFKLLLDNSLEIWLFDVHGY